MGFIIGSMKRLPSIPNRLTAFESGCRTGVESKWQIHQISKLHKPEPVHKVREVYVGSWVMWHHRPWTRMNLFSQLVPTITCYTSAGDPWSHLPIYILLFINTFKSHFSAQWGPKVAYMTGSVLRNSHGRETVIFSLCQFPNRICLEYLQIIYLWGEKDPYIVHDNSLLEIWSRTFQLGKCFLHIDL